MFHYNGRKIISQYEEVVYIVRLKLEPLENLPKEISDKLASAGDNLNPQKRIETTGLINEVTGLNKLTIENNYIKNISPLITLSIAENAVLHNMFSILEGLEISESEMFNVVLDIGVNVTGSESKTKQKNPQYVEMMDASKKFIDNDMDVIAVEDGTLKFEKFISGCKLRVIDHKLSDDEYTAVTLTCKLEDSYLIEKFQLGGFALKDTCVSAYVKYLLSSTARGDGVVFSEKSPNMDILNSLIIEQNTTRNVLKFINESYGIYPYRYMMNYTFDNHLIFCSYNGMLEKLYKNFSGEIYDRTVEFASNLPVANKHTAGPGFEDPTMRIGLASKIYSPITVLNGENGRSLVIGSDKGVETFNLREDYNKGYLNMIGDVVYKTNSIIQPSNTPKEKKDEGVNAKRINYKSIQGNVKMLTLQRNNHLSKLIKTAEVTMFRGDIRPFLLPGFVFINRDKASSFDGLPELIYQVKNYKASFIFGETFKDSRLTSSVTINATLCKVIVDSDD